MILESYCSGNGGPKIRCDSFEHYPFLEKSSFLKASFVRLIFLEMVLNTFLMPKCFFFRPMLVGRSFGIAFVSSLLFFCWRCLPMFLLRLLWATILD